MIKNLKNKILQLLMVPIFPCISSKYLPIYTYETRFNLEVPKKNALIFMIQGCKRNCPECHSPHLHEIEEKNMMHITKIFEIIQNEITMIKAVVFLVGDVYEKDIAKLCYYIKLWFPKIEVGIYTGSEYNKKLFDISLCDFIKFGRYDKDLGGLDSKTTNQQIIRNPSKK